MLKVCPKCGYTRQPTDAAPEYECPKCGVIYSKIGESRVSGINSSPQSARKSPFKEPAQEQKSVQQAKVRLAELFIVGLVMGYFLGREHVKHELRSTFQQTTEVVTSELFSQSKNTKISEKPTEKINYFDIIEPVVYRNYHDRDNPNICTSLEFKATIMNLTSEKRTIETDFYLKDKVGLTLKVVRTSYELDPSSGTKEPRVLHAWHHRNEDYSCAEVTSIELRYSLFNDSMENIMDLPIRDLK